jgi:NTE family protein
MPSATSTATRESLANGPVSSLLRGFFLVFEGGGARGVVHIGALRAIEDLGVNALFGSSGDQVDEEGRYADRTSSRMPEASARLPIFGVSGTSAGAIMAALVAAGYTAEELFARNGSRTLLNDLEIDRATDLFGSAGWWRIEMFRALFRPFGGVRARSRSGASRCRVEYE